MCEGNFTGGNLKPHQGEQRFPFSKKHFGAQLKFPSMKSSWRYIAVVQEMVGPACVVTSESSLSLDEAKGRSLS